jgi:predicted ester cyclase
VAAEENKVVMRRIVEEVINQKSLDVIDELFSSEYIPHPSLPGRTPGSENARRNFSRLHEAFPDIQATIESMVAEADVVAIRMTLSGTHQPTGKRATWPATVFVRYDGGKAVEDWLVADSGQLEAQLG